MRRAKDHLPVPRPPVEFKQARGWLAVLVVTLFIGTLMPDAWRQDIQQASHSPVPLSSWAHFAVFAGMALLMKSRPLDFSVRSVLLVALALALLSEGLQFLTPDRHPRWIDVGIDMSGALLGLALARALAAFSSRR